MEDAEGNGTTRGRLPMWFSRKGRARGRAARCRRAGGPLPAGIPSRIRRGMHGRRVFRIRPSWKMRPKPVPRGSVGAPI
eukprot:5029442-Heterocapsa_arctica.AAC.1